MQLIFLFSTLSLPLVFTLVTACTNTTSIKYTSLSRPIPITDKDIGHTQTLWVLWCNNPVERTHLICFHIERTSHAIRQP